MICSIRLDYLSNAVEKELNCLGYLVLDSSLLYEDLLTGVKQCLASGIDEPNSSTKQKSLNTRSCGIFDYFSKSWDTIKCHLMFTSFAITCQLIKQSLLTITQKSLTLWSFLSTDTQVVFTPASPP